MRIFALLVCLLLSKNAFSAFNACDISISGAISPSCDRCDGLTVKFGSTKQSVCTLGSVLNILGYIPITSLFTSSAEIGLRVTAERNAMSAHICLDEDNEGHPLPYTDDQIIRLMTEAGEDITQDNILNKYDKICVKTSPSAKPQWLGANECLPGGFGICTEQADGYSELICAYMNQSCPCVYSLQHGNLEEPVYKKDANGVYELETSGPNKGQLILDTSKTKYDPAKYARHCRLKKKIRYTDPTDELPGIFGEACYDFKGYSKGANIMTAGIVQCIQDTVLNIFEKPIVRQTSITSIKNDPDVQFGQDIDLLKEYRKNIYAILQDRVLSTEKNVPGYPEFLPLDTEEKTKILDMMKELLFKVNLTSASDYICNTTNYTVKDIKTTKTSFNVKYTDSVMNASPTCCASSALGLGCIKYNSIAMSPSSININPSTDAATMTEDEIIDAARKIFGKSDGTSSNATMLTSIEKMRYDYQQGVAALGVKKSTTLLSIFDVFRNRIKLIAVLAITIWVCMKGFQILLGEISIEASKAAQLIVGVALSYFIIFDDDVKNYAFRMMISTAQGIGIGLYEAVMGFNDTPGNNFAKVCNFKRESSIPIKNRVTRVLNATTGATTSDIVVSCPNANDKLICYKYNLNADRTVDTTSCAWGSCTQYTQYIPRPPYEKPYRQFSVYNEADMPPLCISDVSGQPPVVATLNTFSNDLQTQVYGCNSGYTLAEGYAGLQLLKFKILKETSTEENITNFKDALDPALIVQYQKHPDDAKMKDDIKNSIIKTAFYKSYNGSIKPIDFSANIREAKLRSMHVQSLEALRYKANQTAYYPKILMYDTVRDYSYVSFFDTIDCKFWQYFSLKPLSTSGGSVIENGLLDFAMYISVGVPFGMIIAICMIIISIFLVTFIFRATQSYILSIFGIVLSMYMSPVIFVLKIFDSTAGAFDQWVDSLKKNIFGAGIPFVTVALFLVIVDFGLFGWPDQYSSQRMFTSDGAIDNQCYKDNLGSAPFACIASRLMTDHPPIAVMGRVMASIFSSPLGIFGFTSVNIDFGDFLTLLIYFMWRSIILVGIVAIGTWALGKLEDTLFGLIGGKSDDSQLGIMPWEGNPLEAGIKMTNLAAQTGYTIASTPFKLGSYVKDKISDYRARKKQEAAEKAQRESEQTQERDRIEREERIQRADEHNQRVNEYNQRANAYNQSVMQKSNRENNAMRSKLRPEHRKNPNRGKDVMENQKLGFDDMEKRADREYNKNYDAFAKDNDIGIRDMFGENDSSPANATSSKSVQESKSSGQSKLNQSSNDIKEEVAEEINRSGVVGSKETK